MKISFGDPEAAARVYEILVQDMAEFLVTSGFNLDDPQAVADALYASRFGRASIANLMDRAIGRVRNRIPAAGALH